MSILIGLITVFSLISSSFESESTESSAKSIIDLSHSLNSQTLRWITFKQGFELKVLHNGTKKSGDQTFWLQADEIHMAAHTGTHLDAPCHFAKGKWCVSDIPLERMVDRPVAVIDVVDQSVATRDYEANVEDLKQFEEANGQIPDGAVVLFRTGWARFWPNKLEYFGTDGTDTAYVHFPGIHPDAAKWLVDKRHIYGVGIDSPSADSGQSFGGESRRSHVLFTSQNIFILENVAKNIHKLPPIGAKLTVLPMKVEGGSGSPVTVIATIDTSVSISSVSPNSLSLMVLAFVTLRYIVC